METIDFFEDEDQELPPPMTQKDVILLNRAGAFQDEEAAAQAEADKEDDDAMEVGSIPVSLPCDKDAVANFGYKVNSIEGKLFRRALNLLDAHFQAIWLLQAFICASANPVKAEHTGPVQNVLCKGHSNSLQGLRHAATKRLYC